MNKHTICKQKGFYISELTNSVIWAILLLFSSVLSILFTYTLYNSFQEQTVRTQLKETSTTIANQVEKNYLSINKQVQEAISTSSSISDKSPIANKVASIKQSLPTALRVISSETPLLKIAPTNFPGINYATLHMLKKAKNSLQDPTPEIHLYGQKNQYINFTHTVDSTTDSYIIISLPADEILKNIKAPRLYDGEIILKQSAGMYSWVVLKTWGSITNGNASPLMKIKIPNSYFSVEYHYNSPFYLLRGMTFLSALVGMISSFLLLIALILRKIKKIEQLKLGNTEKDSYMHIDAQSKPKSIQESIKIEHQDKNTINQNNKASGLDKTIFRAYDIRGIVDETLTAETVKLIGQAIGTENIKRGKKDIVIARDGRLSGEELLKALSDGLIKSGCNVINIGAVPTGVLYFATHHLETGSGVMLTGSHNPANYNGLKIMLDGETLAGELIMDLYNSIINHELDEGEGSEQEMDIVDDYIDYIASDIQLENELKVVVDCGNGIGGDVGPLLLEEIGCEVIRLHCEIDGNFPNHHPDPSVPENLEDLMAAVKATDADIGIAFDGDADRLGVVTKDGEIIYPDRLLMLFAQDVLTRQPGASIIFDVKCTGHLPKEIVKYGGLPIIWKTGHSFMKAKIKETQAALAGEMSGHFFFNERWFGFDDGIYAAARLLEILDHENRPAIEIFDELPNSISTAELKCHTQEGENYAFMEKFQEVVKFPDAHLTRIDGVRADFANGWGLIRCSNTTPCLVLRFDANSQEELDKIKEEFRKQILAVDSSLELPF